MSGAETTIVRGDTYYGALYTTSFNVFYIYATYQQGKQRIICYYQKILHLISEKNFSSAVVLVALRSFRRRFSPGITFFFASDRALLCAYGNSSMMNIFVTGNVCNYTRSYPIISRETPKIKDSSNEKQINDRFKCYTIGKN